MTTQIKVLSPTQRVAIAVAAGVAVVVLAGIIYLWVIAPAVSGNQIQPLTKATAAKMVDASRFYARSLQARGQPVPASAPLSNLVKAGLLQPQDVSAFEGLDVTIALQTNEMVFTPELMRVHMRDGTDVILSGDGRIYQQGQH